MVQDLEMGGLGQTLESRRAPAISSLHEGRDFFICFIHWSVISAYYHSALYTSGNKYFLHEFRNLALEENLEFT